MQKPSPTAHIFVLEDDRDILDAVKEILTLAGYGVTTMSRAEELEPQLQKITPDLILLDIWVGGGDGRDAAKWLRQQEQTKHIPIIMVSANISTPQIAKDLKVEDFVLKPFDMDHLLSVIHKRLKKAGDKAAAATAKDQIYP